MWTVHHDGYPVFEDFRWRCWMFMVPSPHVQQLLWPLLTFAIRLCTSVDRDLLIEVPKPLGSIAHICGFDTVHNYYVNCAESVSSSMSSSHHGTKKVLSREIPDAVTGEIMYYVLSDITNNILSPNVVWISTLSSNLEALRVRYNRQKDDA